MGEMSVHVEKRMLQCEKRGAKQSLAESVLKRMLVSENECTNIHIDTLSGQALLKSSKGHSYFFIMIFLL